MPYKTKILRIRLDAEGFKRTRGVAALMMAAFYPKVRAGAKREAYHLDKNEINCNIDNLKVINF